MFHLRIKIVSRVCQSKKCLVMSNKQIASCQFINVGLNRKILFDRLVTFVCAGCRYRSCRKFAVEQAGGQAAAPETGGEMGRRPIVRSSKSQICPFSLFCAPFSVATNPQNIPRLVSLKLLDDDDDDDDVL